MKIEKDTEIFKEHTSSLKQSPYIPYESTQIVSLVYLCFNKLDNLLIYRIFSAKLKLFSNKLDFVD